MLSCIYKATNTVTKKIYIGFTVDFNSRVQQHKVNSISGSNKLYNSIRKHGWESFVWEIIYMSHDEKHCHQIMEPKFITEYNSINNGYNTTEGGLGVVGAVRERVWINDGINHLRVLPSSIPEGWALGRIGLKRSFNSKWKPDRTPRRSYTGSNNPSAKKLSINGITYNTMKEAVESLNISEPTIRKRCKTTSSKYINWFYA